MKTICESCNGTGEAYDFQDREIACPDCAGLGEMEQDDDMPNAVKEPPPYEHARS